MSRRSSAGRNRSRSPAQRRGPERSGAERSRPAWRAGTTQTELAVGFHAVTALLERHPKRVVRVLCDQQRDEKRIKAVMALAAEKGVGLERVDRDELDVLAPDLPHQGVLAEFRPRVARPVEELIPHLQSCPQPWLVLALDGVQDPHNLGACLRSADAAGVHAVVIPSDRAASLGPAARKAAAGAAESVELFAVTNLSRTLQNLQTEGLWVYGAAGEGGATLWTLNLKDSVVLVLGAEGEGLRRLTRERCDGLYRLPMHGAVSSLNVSVAAGVSLYEVLRQRGG